MLLRRSVQRTMYDPRRLDVVAPPPDIFDRALDLQRDLAHHHGMWLRIPIPDLLIAETALHHGLGVVHVDRATSALRRPSQGPPRPVVVEDSGALTCGSAGQAGATDGLPDVTRVVDDLQAGRDH